MVQIIVLFAPSMIAGGILFHAEARIHRSAGWKKQSIILLCGGAIAALCAFFGVLMVRRFNPFTGITGDIWDQFIAVGTVEEGMKLIALMLSYKITGYYFHSRASLIRAAAIAAIGFACVENSWYILHPFPLAAIRGTVTVSAHILFGAIAAQVLFPPRKLRYVCYFGGAVILHGLYNILISMIS